MSESVWLDNSHYYIIQAGQFGYGWDLYRKGNTLIAMSGLLCRTREDAAEEARAAFKTATTE
jgi:hypothetical protein